MRLVTNGSNFGTVPLSNEHKLVGDDASTTRNRMSRDCGGCTKLVKLSPRWRPHVEVTGCVACHWMSWATEQQTVHDGHWSERKVL